MSYRAIFTILLIAFLIAGFSVRIPVGLSQPPESGQKQLDSSLLDKMPIKKLRAMDMAQRRLDRLNDVKKRLLHEHDRYDRWIKHRDTAAAREQPALRGAIVQLVHFDSAKQFVKPGSGVVVHPTGLVLTASHVIRRDIGPAGCSNIPQGSLARWIVVLISEKEDQPPVARYAISLEQENDIDLIEAREFDLALLRITHKLQDDPPRTYPELISKGFTPVELPPEERRTLNLSALPPWDSTLLRPYPLPGEPPNPAWAVDQVKVLGYPKENPVLIPSEGEVRTADQANGLFYLTGAKLFATYGESGGAVIDRERPLLLGLLCGGMGTGVGALAVNRMINNANSMFETAKQRFGITINRAPVPHFTITPDSPEPDTPVSFDASTSKDLDGRIVEYRWVFIDGEEEFPQPPHPYPQTTFTFRKEKAKAKLTVRDDHGQEVSVEQPLNLSLGKRLAGCSAQVEGQPTTYSRLQDAIQAAPEGAVITFTGECEQNVTVDKRNLSLKGFERPRLVGDGKQPVVKVIANGVTVEGFLLERGSTGVLVSQSARVTLKDNVIRDHRGHGVQIISSVEVKLANNKITANDQAGLQITKAEEFPLSSSVSLEHNTVTANQNKGLVVQGRSKATLANDVFEDNIGAGISVNEGSTIVQRGVQINKTRSDPAGDFGQGIIVEGDSKLEMIGGSISQNEWTGLHVDSSSAELKDNVLISDNERFGFVALGSAQVSLTDSTVSGNWEYGLMVEDSASVSLTGSTVSDNVGGGLIIVGEAKAEITDSRITGTRPDAEGEFGDGIEIRDEGKLTLSNSIVTGNPRVGIGLWDEASTVIHQATVSNNGRGIYMQDSARVSVQNSTLTGNGPYGIFMRDSTQANIQENIIKEHEIFGIALDLSPCTHPPHSFQGKVEGKSNRIGNDLCPRDYSWPQGFATPIITRVNFPSEISVNQEQKGSVLFPDPDRDITQIEFEIITGDPNTITVLPGMKFDPKVRGRTTDSIAFSINVSKPQKILMRVTLMDAGSNRSDPWEFSFEAK